MRPAAWVSTSNDPAHTVARAPPPPPKHPYLAKPHFLPMHPYLAGTAASVMYSEVGEKESDQPAEDKSAEAPGALGLPPPSTLDKPAGS